MRWVLRRWAFLLRPREPCLKLSFQLTFQDRHCDSRHIDHRKDTPEFAGLMAAAKEFDVVTKPHTTGDEFNFGGVHSKSTARNSSE